jgi:hypothetical protein
MGERFEKMSGPLESIVQNDGHRAASSFFLRSFFSSGPTDRVHALLAQVGTPSFGSSHTTTTTHNTSPRPATIYSFIESIRVSLSSTHYKNVNYI